MYILFHPLVDLVQLLRHINIIYIEIGIIDFSLLIFARLYSFVCDVISIFSFEFKKQDINLFCPP